MNIEPPPERTVLYEGALVFIFREQWPDGRAQYAFELWSCDDPIKVCIHKVYSTAETAFVALADFFEDPEQTLLN